MASPVIAAQRGEARKATTSATSSASTMRRIVLRPRVRSASSALMPWAAAMVAAQAKAQGVSEEAVLQRMTEGNSIRHLVDASEVADVVAFLCSPKSVAINGDAIAAGGGAPRAIHS